MLAAVMLWRGIEAHMHISRKEGSFRRIFIPASITIIQKIALHFNTLIGALNKNGILFWDAVPVTVF